MKKSDKLSSVIEEKRKESRKNTDKIPFPFKPYNSDDYSGLEQGQHSLMFEKK